VKEFSYTTCATTFHRFLNDRDLKGTVYEPGIDLVIEQGEPLILCYGHILYPYVSVAITQTDNNFGYLLTPHKSRMCYQLQQNFNYYSCTM
jgi:hypothetical protein